MARFNGYDVLEVAREAAAAGTTNGIVYVPKAFLARGFYWVYESTEANADNTFDFDISHDNGDLDGTYDVAVFTNANANGLADTGVAGAIFVNRRNAASGGAAAAAASDPADVRVPTSLQAGAGIRFQLVTAGTGTIPKVRLGIYGHYL